MGRETRQSTVPSRLSLQPQYEMFLAAYEGTRTSITTVLREFSGPPCNHLLIWMHSRLPRLSLLLHTSSALLSPQLKV